VRSGEYQEERKTEQHATVDALQIRAQTEHWAAEITSSSKCRTEEVSYGCSLLPSIPPSRKNKKRIGSGRTPRTVTSARNIIAKLRRSRTRRQKTRPLKQRLRRSSRGSTLTPTTWERAAGGRWQMHCASTPRLHRLTLNPITSAGPLCRAARERAESGRWQRHCTSTTRLRRSTLATITWERAEGGRWQRHCASTPRWRRAGRGTVPQHHAGVARPLQQSPRRGRRAGTCRGTATQHHAHVVQHQHEWLRGHSCFRSGSTVSTSQHDEEKRRSCYPSWIGAIVKLCHSR